MADITRVHIRSVARAANPAMHYCHYHRYACSSCSMCIFEERSSSSSQIGSKLSSFILRSFSTPRWVSLHMHFTYALKLSNGQTTGTWHTKCHGWTSTPLLLKQLVTPLLFSEICRQNAWRTVLYVTIKPQPFFCPRNGMAMQCLWTAYNSTANGVCW